jgi:hypothetical protein
MPQANDISSNRFQEVIISIRDTHNFEAPVVCVKDLDSEFPIYIKNGPLTENEKLMLDNHIKGDGNLFDLYLMEQMIQNDFEYEEEHNLPHQEQNELPIFEPNEMFTSEIIESVRDEMPKWVQITDDALNYLSTQGLKSTTFVIKFYDPGFYQNELYTDTQIF